MAKQRVQPKVLASWGKDLSASPFLAALHDREEWVRNGKLTVSVDAMSAFAALYVVEPTLSTNAVCAARLSPARLSSLAH